jgi:Ribosomal protein L34E
MAIFRGCQRVAGSVGSFIKRLGLRGRMVEGKKRSRSMRRVKCVTPGHKVVTHYRRRKPNAAHCAETGQQLHGIPRGRSSGIRKLTRSQRRPERPYGGQLSSQAMRKKLIERARTLYPEDDGDTS